MIDEVYLARLVPSDCCFYRHDRSALRGVTVAPLTRSLELLSSRQKRVNSCPSSIAGPLQRMRYNRMCYMCSSEFYALRQCSGYHTIRVHYIEAHGSNHRSVETSRPFSIVFSCLFCHEHQTKREGRSNSLPTSKLQWNQQAGTKDKNMHVLRLLLLLP